MVSLAFGALKALTYWFLSFSPKLFKFLGKSKAKTEGLHNEELRSTLKPIKWEKEPVKAKDIDFSSGNKAESLEDTQ